MAPSLETIQDAVELYSQAVIAERQGRVNDALKAYRLAFRKNDEVDKLYHRQQARVSAKEAEQRKTPEDVDSLAFEYERTLQIEPDYDTKRNKTRDSTQSYVDKLMQSFTEHPYDPEDPRREKQVVPITPKNGTAPVQVFHRRSTLRSMPIEKLPDEILLSILSHLTALTPRARYPDVSSLERGWSLSCRKARIMSLQATNIWRDMCLGVYIAPLQIPLLPAIHPEADGTDFQQERHSDPNPCSRVCMEQYKGDWRRMWLEHPRIRTDGVYISQITYLRRGAQDGSFYDPTHLVTYYRYLVFLPSGDVVSLLSHEAPTSVVPTLLSAAHNKQPAAGYTVGRWRILHRDATSSSDRQSNSTLVQLSSLEDPRVSSPRDIKYSFKMLCQLKSTARGRMNKLEMISLMTLNHRTNDESPIPIKQANNSRPTFFFSRVLSYD